MTEPVINTYINSAEFPEAAVNLIPDELLHAIDSGNKEFFNELAKDFPKTYAGLVQSEPIRLYEVLTRRRSIDNSNEVDCYYCWGLPLGDRVLVVNIPKFNPEHKIRKQLQSRYLSAMPTEFTAFYKRMDGMGIAEYIAFSACDLPMGFSDWRNIHEYYPEQGLQEGYAVELVDALVADELRVVFTCSNGDFVLTDIGKANGTMYLVRRSSLDSAEIIKSISLFDNYFAEVIQNPSQIITF